MIVASYIFAVTSLVKATSAATQVVHKTMEMDLNGVNGLMQGTDLKLAEPRLANFLDVACQCNYTNEGSWTQLLEFNAIVFEGFATFGSQDILGRLAVGGDLTAPGYVVNANSGEQCYGANTVPWDQLALAVGGNILSPSTEVHGHWWTAGAGTAVELNTGCNSPANVDQPFPFAAIQTLLNGYSQAYASMAPNLVLNDDDSITDLGTLPSGCINVMTLQPCHNSNSNNCIANVNSSFSDHILLGQPNWNGPSNGYPNPNRLLIINVPVFNGEAIDITTNQPSAGANDCNLIWNFYPVDITGDYYSTGSFQLVRNTGNPFQGVTLAPKGNILDGPEGVFQGVIFANSYSWNQVNGVEIHNTPSCNGYGFCAPSGQATSPQGSSLTTSSSTAPASSTASQSSPGPAQGALPQSTTPESSSSPAQSTTPVSSTTPEFTTSPAQSTTPVSSPTSESSSSPAQSTTPVSSPTSESSSSPAQSTTPVSSPTSESSSSPAQSTTPVSSPTSESSSSPAQSTTPVSSPTSESSSSPAQSTTPVLSTTPEFTFSPTSESSSSPAEYTTSALSTAPESSSGPVESTTPLSSVTPESFSSSSESSTQASSSTSVISISINRLSITAPTFPASTRHILSSTRVTSVGIVGFSNTASNLPAGTTQISSSILNTAPSVLNNCRRHHHHHYKHDEVEKYDDEGHDWDDEKKHKHKDHQEYNDDWNNDKHKHEDHQKDNDDWDDDKLKHKDHQGHHDDWDIYKRKRGESEDEGYWEDECEDDTHYYDNDNDE